jgi:hypothetical protein
MGIKAGKEYELLVEKIFREISPDATVKHNDSIYGHIGERNRQIDVSIRSKIDDKDYLIIVEAKDYKHKVDVKEIGAFKSIIEDVRADKGIMVCNQGYSKTALRFARNTGIEVHSAYSALNKRWDLEHKIPIIKTAFDFDFEAHFIFHPDDLVNGTITIPKEQILSTDDGKTTMNLIFFLISYYGEDDFDYSGKEKGHTLTNYPIKILSGGVWLPIRHLIIKYKFAKKSKLINYLKITDYLGLKDNLTDKYIHTSMKIPKDNVLAMLDDENWQKLKSDDDIPLNPNVTYIEMVNFRYENMSYTMHRYKNTPKK